MGSGVSPLTTDNILTELEKLARGICFKVGGQQSSFHVLLPPVQTQTMGSETDRSFPAAAIP